MPNFMRYGVKHSAYQMPNSVGEETATLPPIWLRHLLTSNQASLIAGGGLLDSLQLPGGIVAAPGGWVVRTENGLLVFTDTAFKLEFTPEE